LREKIKFVIYDFNLKDSRLQQKRSNLAETDEALGGHFLCLIEKSSRKGIGSEDNLVDFLENSRIFWLTWKFRMTNIWQGGGFSSLGPCEVTNYS